MFEALNRTAGYVGGATAKQRSDCRNQSLAQL
jgi:hypothetical protein